MKKLSILLILSLCFFLLPIHVFAAETSTYDDYAESLSELGVFVGTGNGFELDRAPTRIEGLVMLIRLLGAEDEANNRKGAALPFTDVPKWATGYVAYAYENGLTNGINSTKFGSNNKIEAKAFLTFLLRSLGYNDGAGDFSYQNALVFSNSIGLVNDTTYSNLNSTTFLRAHIAKTAYDTLKFPYKGGKTLLVDKLMAENKIGSAVGNAFKKTVLTDPLPLVIQNKGAIDVEHNLNSVVMLECYGAYSDEYGPDIGSGVILSSDGRIVTNYHVIEDVHDINITFNDETVYDGKVYVEDYDKDLDLAIIKIDKTGLTPATLGNSSEVKAGAAVITIGSPYGYRNTVTEGIVSAIRSDSIQISAAINPGNSGGGLFNADGKLIGIPNAMFYTAENMGFAIPINLLSAVSGSQKILLKDFYAMNTEPLPPAPTGLHVVYETGTTALLNWNPVANADCYYIYCKEEGDYDYYYLDTAYYGKNYSYLAVGMTKGEQYSFKVTAERGEQESEMSSALTFKKSAANMKYGSFNLFYSGFENVPDFGKLAGITPYQTATNQFSYEIGDVMAMVLVDYEYLLEDSGFFFDSTTRKADGTAVQTYKNEALKQSVVIYSKISLDDEEYTMRIEIIKE